jgi:hypothetical protein
MSWDVGSWPTASDVAVQANVGLQVNCGSGSLVLETLKMPSRPGELHPESLTDPDVILSHHPARATMRRLPPSIDDQVPPAAG